MQAITQPTFEELWQRHHSHLVSRARTKWKLSEEEARDLVQEVGIKAFQAFSQFRQATCFRNWTMSILVNVAIDRYRQQQKWPLSYDHDAEIRDMVLGLLSLSPGEGDAAAIYEARTLVQEVLCIAWERWNEKDRVVMCRLAAGYRLKELAESEGVSREAISARIHRARRRVIEAMPAELRAYFSV